MTLLPRVPCGALLAVAACGDGDEGPTEPSPDDLAEGKEIFNELLHEPSEVPTDPTHAQRSTTKMYRTTPLRGIWQHPPYFHDGSAATLGDLVERYDAASGLGLTVRQKADLVEYLKSL